MSDSQPIQDIRNQLKEEQKARQEMEAELQELRTYRQQNVFREAGFDPDSGPGKALAKLHDGEFTVEALRETAESYGLSGGDTTTSGGEQPLSDAAAAVHEASNVISEAQRGSAPTGGAKMAYDDFKALSTQDPRAAAQVLHRGGVDLPPHIASAMSTRDSTPVR